MNGLIVYNGKYGATKQYAEWVAEELHIPLLTTTEVTQNDLEQCDLLLLGTSVYFGRLRIRAWVKKNLRQICRRRAFIFIVGATTLDQPEIQAKILTGNIPGEVRSNSKMFFLPGRVIHHELTICHKLALNILGLFEKDPGKRDALRRDIDKVKKENIKPIIDAVNAFCLITSGARIL